MKFKIHLFKYFKNYLKNCAFSIPNEFLYHNKLVWHDRYISFETETRSI